MKRIIALLLAVSVLLLTLGCTVSCKDNTTDDNGGTTPVDPDNGNNNNNQTEKGIDYSVTLKDIFGNPIAGVSLKFTYGNESTEVVVSGADGKATKKIDTYDDVIVEFVDLLGYGNLSKAKRNLNGETEKTLVLPTVATLTVVDADGNPIEGVEVQICHNVCIPPQPTNAEGVVKGSIDSTERVKVNIVSVPEGFVVPEVIDTYANTPIHAYFAEGEYTLTLVLESA